MGDAGVPMLATRQSLPAWGTSDRAGNGCLPRASTVDIVSRLWALGPGSRRGGHTAIGGRSVRP